jgi:hypothetical protein
MAAVESGAPYWPGGYGYPPDAAAQFAPPHGYYPPPGWPGGAAAFVARVPAPTAVRLAPPPYGYAPPSRAPPPYAYAQPQQPQEQRQPFLPPRAPSPSQQQQQQQYVRHQATAPAPPGALPTHASSFEHAHLARRNARLEERLADSARDKREMAAHFETLLAQVRAPSSPLALQTSLSPLAPS